MVKLLDNSNCKILVLPFIVAAALWLIGGFFLSKEMGMVCVILGIAIAGWAAGKAMNTECEISDKQP
ncbi:MAG: hypothetical protein Q7T38_09610 [Gallionella sp.]|nr:hypothetical protein [Gallionella sp.]